MRALPASHMVPGFDDPSVLSNVFAVGLRVLEHSAKVKFGKPQSSMRFSK